MFVMVGCLISPLAAKKIDADNVSKEGPKTYPLYDDIQLTSAIKYTYGTNKIVVKSVFPQLESETLNLGVDHFNELIGRLVSEGISGFNSRVMEAHLLQEALPKKRIKNDLYIDYSAAIVSSSKSYILSVRLTFQGQVAGKHPYHYHRVLNYDLDKDQEIILSDLFEPDSDYLFIIAQYCKEMLSKRLANQSMIVSGTLAEEKNFSNWNLKTNGLLFTFDEYQVAPDVLGTQTVLVPFSVLKRVIAPNSVLAPCGKKRKRCLKNNLLTGGFIDEAVNSTHRTFNPIFSKL